MCEPQIKSPVAETPPEVAVSLSRNELGILYRLVDTETRAAEQEGLEAAALTRLREKVSDAIGRYHSAFKSA